MIKTPPSLFRMCLKCILNSTTRSFKSIILFAYFLIHLSFNSSAQSYPKIHQSWTFAAGKIADLETYYCIEQCNAEGADSVLIKVFNQKPFKDTVDFDIIIYKQNKSDSITKSINLKMDIAQMAYPNCGTGLFQNLKIGLPSDYDPKKVTIFIKLK